MRLISRRIYVYVYDLYDASDIKGRIYPALPHEVNEFGRVVPGKNRKWEDTPEPGVHEDPYFETDGKVYFSEIQHAQYDAPPSYAVTEQ